MRSGTLPSLALLVCAISACGGGGGSGAAIAPALPPPSPPAYTSWTLAGPAGVRMAPLMDDRLAIAAASNGSVGFASPFVNGTYAGGTLSWTMPVAFGGGPVTYGRGADGALYSGNLVPNQSAAPYVRNETTGATWSLLPASCSGVPACNPFPQEYPMAIIAGPDGATWVLTINGMVRLNPDGTTTIHPLSVSYGGAEDADVGADGAFWVAEEGGTIERIPLSGAGSSYAVGGHPTRIAAGADGALWFLDTGGRVRRVTTVGSVTTVVASVSGGVAAGDAIARGGDGAMWFTEAAANKLARIAPSGAVTEYAVPNAAGTPSGVTSASDGSLWFLEQFRGLTLVHAVLSPAAAGS